jgi:hypothetical protein
MAADLEWKDKAERNVETIRARRDRLFNRAFWGLLIAFSVYAGLHRMLGSAYESWSKWIIWAVIGFPAVGWLNELGVFDHHAELRRRTKQINERLAAIESMLNKQSDQIEKNSDSISGHLGCTRFAEDDWRDFSWDRIADSPSGFTSGAGFPKAQFRLGLHYAFGVQVKKDPEQLVYWFRIAAEYTRLCSTASRHGLRQRRWYSPRR